MNLIFAEKALPCRMILAGGTGSSGESKINAAVKSQIATLSRDPNLTERLNSDKINDNLKAVVDKLLEYFLDFSIKLQGYMLQPYYNQASNLAVVPGNSKLFTPDLLERTRFFLLLHLRRIVTTFEGSCEDYLDEVVGYKSYTATSDEKKLSQELQDLVSCCYTSDPFSKVQVDRARTLNLQNLVADAYSRHTKRCSATLLREAANHDRSKSVDVLANDPASLRQQVVPKLTEGLRNVQTLERELENAQLRVKITQDYAAIQEASNQEIRTKLLKDVVHLRDTLFRKNHEKLKDDDIYRVDYFSVNDIADEPIRLLLNDKINKVDQAFRTRLKKLQDELQEANLLIKDYDQQLNSNNPSVISSLIKRVHGLLNKDNNMLWKVLQEAIGADWFQRVLIKRDLNHRYHIEYEPLDSLLPELNKMVMKRNPSDTSKLGSQMDAVLLNYLIETFQEQKKELLKELSNKQQARFDKLIEGYDDLVLEEAHSYVEPELQKMQTTPNQANPSPRSQMGAAPRSVSIKVSESRVPGTIAASKIETGKSLAVKSSPKSSSNHIADEGVLFRGEDGSELSASALKARFRMLLNEIHNLKSDKVAVVQNMAALQGQFKILEGLVMELAEAAGVAKEGLALVNLVGKCKKLDAKVLAKNNFSKILSQGKIDGIARLAIMASLNSYGMVTKSTNTGTDEYDDLAMASAKHGGSEPFRDAVNKVIKLKSRIKDNESMKSSGSKLSMSKKFSTIRESKKPAPESPKLSLNKKVTLDSLVEEPDTSPVMAESMTKESPEKRKNPTFSQMENAHQRNKEKEAASNQSPINMRRVSKVGRFNDITQSMEFGAPSKHNQGFSERMAANIKVRRFESETKQQGQDLSLHSHTINSKNQGSAFEEYSHTKLKRVESLSNDSEGEGEPQVIRQRMASETRTGQKVSGAKGQENSSPLKGTDRKSKTMLPHELLEPSSPVSEQIYFNKGNRSELDTFHPLDIFMTGGIQIHGAKKHIIKPQLELFSGASLTEGGLAGKFDSSLATAAMRIQSGNTNIIEDPAGLLEGGLGRRPKKRSQNNFSPLRQTSIVKTSQFEVPEVDSTDSPRLNTLSGLQAREIKLESPGKQEQGRTKTPSSKVVLHSMVSKDEKTKFSGGNFKRWQEQANSSLVDDSNSSRSKRDRETDRSIAPLPEKQRAIMRMKHTTTDSVLVEKVTREENRRIQLASRGNEEFSAERRPNSASGTQNKFYEDNYQPAQERIKTGKIGQPSSPSRGMSRGLGSGSGIRDAPGLSNKLITQSGNLDDSINPWAPGSNHAIGKTLTNLPRAPPEEIQTDSDLERIKLTMRQRENTARELEANPSKPPTSPLKNQKPRAAARSMSPQNSPGRQLTKSPSIPKVPRLQGLSEPLAAPEPKRTKSKSPQNTSNNHSKQIHERLFQEARSRLENKEFKADEVQAHNRNKWDDFIHKNTGVLCNLAVYLR